MPVTRAQRLKKGPSRSVWKARLVMASVAGLFGQRGDQRGWLWPKLTAE